VYKQSQRTAVRNTITEENSKKKGRVSRRGETAERDGIRGSQAVRATIEGRSKH
jgi:hypothetical protein